MRASWLWNALGMLLIGLTAFASLLSAWLFIYPQSRLNPFPPTATPQGISLPSPAWSPAPGALPPDDPPLSYPTLPPEWTKTPIPPPTFTRTPRPTRTPTETPTATPTATPTPTLPSEARISGVVGHSQTLSLDCEARSAADWAGFFGVNIDEMEFFHRLPVSDNPEIGFVGDVNDPWGYLPPKGYGVYAGPVADLLQAYGARAQAGRNLSWETLQKEIVAGRPVIVWIVGHVWDGKPVDYTAEDGQTTVVARYEHTVIVIGYSATRVLVVDEDNVYYRPLTTFLHSWSVLGNMAILWKPGTN